MGNALYYGDNLDMLREHVADASVDLVYLDPPFNSNARYNVLFRTPDGERSAAQAEAFQDTWQWNELAEASYDEIMSMGGKSAEILRSLRTFLGTSDMMAYLVMMANRIHELHRVLKETGSLYLHCDPTASHYLKIVLDGIFGPNNFRTEISWRRQSAHNDAKQGRRQFGNVRDTIFFYTKSDEWKWNWLYTPYDEEYIKNFYKFVEPATGRRYRLGDITAPGGASPEKRNPHYEFLGVKRYWRYSRERMEELYKEGRIVQTKKGNVPAYKRYLDEMPGVALQNDWDDIKPVMGGEAVGYPTQKPLALLERIIKASSNEGDVVLDPFCGCGTTVHAAQKAGRQWIGIDVAHYAIGVIEDRLRGEFGDKAKFEVGGRPVDLEGARELARRDKYQFQWWANWLVGVQNYRERRKGADSGIDGVVYFRNVGASGTGRIIVSVKGGDHVGPDMVRALAGTLERERAELGLLVTLAEPSATMRREAAALGFCKTAHGKFPKVQIATVEELLDNDRPQLPPRYEVNDDELVLRKGRKKPGDPQMDFTFTIRGDKDGKTYPAERYVGRAWARATHPSETSTRRRGEA